MPKISEAGKEAWAVTARLTASGSAAFSASYNIKPRMSQSIESATVGVREGREAHDKHTAAKPVPTKAWSEKRASERKPKRVIVQRTKSETRER
jgi:hypothetical protein